MAQIPSGSGFGQVRPEPVKMGGIGGPSTAIADGLNALGAGISNAVEQDQALKRAKAGNMVLDRQLQVRTVSDQLSQQLRDGTIAYDEAPKAYQSAIEKLQMPKVDGLGGVASEHFNQQIKRLDMAGLDTLQPSINANRTATFRSQADQAIDTIGKQVILGADVNGLNTQLDAYDQIGQVAYGMGWGKVKQDARDRNWYNQAAQRAVQSRDDIKSLQVLEQELSDPKGFYADKLDADRRNSLLRGVTTDITQLENRAQMQADRREAGAVRTVGQVDQQLSSGVPATAEQWQQWQTSVKGTSQEPELRARMQEETIIQNVLRLPIDQQASYVQQRRGELMTKGGTVRDQANLNRLEGVVTANVKQLQESPLLYAQNRTGVQVEPLDFTALAQPGGADKMREQMQSRLDTIAATQKQYGPQVKTRPLLPQEATMLASSLSQSPPRQARDLLGLLRQSIGDDGAFQAAMQQIAPDSPLKAMAGILASKQRKLTLERNWIDDDVVVSTGDIAMRLLSGEQLLKGTSSGGQAKFPIPSEEAFDANLSSDVKKAFAGMGDRYRSAVQLVRTYYAALSDEAGEQSKDIDQARLGIAVRTVLGDPVETGQGSIVFPPWGMDESSFKDKAQQALRFAIRNKHLVGMTDDLDQYSLEMVADKEGVYRARIGRSYLIDKQGNPVTINVLAPASSWGRQ